MEAQTFNMQLEKFWKIVENYRVEKPQKELKRKKKKKERVKKRDGRIKNKVGFEKEEELTEEKVAEIVKSYKRLLDSGLLDKVE